jgi:CheY-like chemotaxis protein
MADTAVLKALQTPHWELRLIDLFEPSEVLILVADDNPVNIKLERTILEKKGYRTAAAYDGEACILQTRELRPNLILLDISMPSISGIEVCRILKKDALTRDIPVIFVTAATDDQTLTAAFESGGTDYVRKPANRVELLARIKSTLAQQRMIKKLVEDEKLTGVLEMAGAICHELNQPMQTICAYTELIALNLEDRERLGRDLKKIKTQIDRMAKITQKLMRITKYETRDYVEGQKIIDIDKASSQDI